MLARCFDFKVCGQKSCFSRKRASCRKANVENLGLENAGIEYSDRGIKVDSHLRTKAKNIYASGDVIDTKIPKLTPTAEFDSNYIALDILLPIHSAIKYPPVPNLVFTLPRIAQTGVTIKEAKKKLGVRDLGKMIFAFPTVTYGLIGLLQPLFLKK